MHESLSKYEKLALIGTGPTANVFRGRNRELNKGVAIKELLEGLQLLTQRRRRFFSEAEHWGSLNHENLLHVYDVDLSRGWIIRELMESNAAAMLCFPNDATVVREFLEQSLRGLSHLHNLGFLHCNLRPSNVLFDAEGTLKISDGRAVRLDALGELPTPIGTAKYLAPEMVDESAGSIGPAVDLYCLGMIALELLVGQRFDALLLGEAYADLDTEAGWLRWHRSESEGVPPVRDLAPDTPHQLIVVLERLIAKPLSQRFNTAEEALAELTTQTTEAESQPDASSVSEVRPIAQRPDISMPSTGPLTPRPELPIILRVASGSRAGEMIGLDREEFLIGESEDAQVRFDTELDAGISGCRVEIRRDGSGWRMRQLGNATLVVNGAPVGKMTPLHSGDIVRLSLRGPDFQFLLQDKNAMPLAEIAKRFGLKHTNPGNSYAPPAAPQPFAAPAPHPTRPTAQTAAMEYAPLPPAPTPTRQYAPAAPPAPPSKTPAQPDKKPATATQKEPLWKRVSDFKNWDKRTKNWVAGVLTGIVGLLVVVFVPTGSKKPELSNDGAGKIIVNDHNQVSTGERLADEVTESAKQDDGETDLVPVEN